MARVNAPLGILKTSSKAYLIELQEFCPPVRIVRSQAEIQAFLNLHPIVLKPLNGYGGKGIIRLEKDQAWIGKEACSMSQFWDFYQQDPIPYLAMKFLKNVSQGYKRIVVMNGEAVGASLRMPQGNDWICNAAQGGISGHSELDDAEQLLVKGLSQELAKEGIILYGADTLVNDQGQRVLSEVNVMSIGGILQIDQQHPEKGVVTKLAEQLISFFQEKNTNQHVQ